MQTFEAPQDCFFHSVPFDHSMVRASPEIVPSMFHGGPALIEIGLVTFAFAGTDTQDRTSAGQQMQRRGLQLAALLCACSTASNTVILDAEFHPTNRGWGSPVWQDEFNGTSLDATKWVVARFCGDAQRVSRSDMWKRAAFCLRGPMNWRLFMYPTTSGLQRAATQDAKA